MKYASSLNVRMIPEKHQAYQQPEMTVGSVVLDDPRVRGSVLGFLRLAVAALLVSGVYVTLVAIARTPLVELIAGRSYLYAALVAHVIFALDVWLLAFVALLWVTVAARIGTPIPVRVTRPGLALAWAGAVFMALVPLAGLGQPVMADYVPLLLHPLFVLGLVAFFAGIALIATGLVVATHHHHLPAPLVVQSLRLGAIGYLVALAMFLLAVLRWGTDDYAAVVWGGGHLFQLVNATALIATWLMVAPVGDRHAVRAIQIGFWGFVVAIAAVVLVHVSPLRWDQVGIVFWGGVGFPLVVTMAVVVGSVIRHRRANTTPLLKETFLHYALVLLGIGGLIALLGLGSDIRVTAHYHASVGAVTMMFMGLAYQILPQLHRRPAGQGFSRLQIHLYGGGLLLLVAGLYWAGSAGTPRKIFEAISSDPSLLPAASLFGLGALLTVAGGMLFIFGVGTSLVGETTLVTDIAPPGKATSAGPVPSRS